MGRSIPEVVCMLDTYGARPEKGQFPPGLEDLKTGVVTARECVSTVILAEMQSSPASDLPISLISGAEGE